MPSVSREERRHRGDGGRVPRYAPGSRPIASTARRRRTSRPSSACSAACCCRKDAIADVVEVLRGGDFYQPAHQTVYDAIIDLYGRGEPADPVTVAAS